MDAQELVRVYRRLSVLFNEKTQFIARVDASRFCPTFDQAASGVLILTEEDRRAQSLGVYHDKGQLKQHS